MQLLTIIVTSLGLTMVPFIPTTRESFAAFITACLKTEQVTRSYGGVGFGVGIRIRVETGVEVGVETSQEIHQRNVKFDVLHRSLHAPDCHQPGHQRDYNVANGMLAWWSFAIVFTVAFAAFKNFFLGTTA